MTTDTAIDPAELDALLRADKTGEVRDAAIARVEEIARGLKAKLDGGVNPAEFQALSDVHAAMSELPSVITVAWKLMRSND